MPRPLAETLPGNATAIFVNPLRHLRFVFPSHHATGSRTLCFMPDITFAGSTILIVEDDLLLRKQIGARLEALDADVLLTASVAEARQAVSSSSFDFALLDVHLPDGRGTDLLKEKLFSSDTGVIVM